MLKKDMIDLILPLDIANNINILFYDREYVTNYGVDGQLMFTKPSCMFSVDDYIPIRKADETSMSRKPLFGAYFDRIKDCVNSAYTRSTYGNNMKPNTTDSEIHWKFHSDSETTSAAPLSQNKVNCTIVALNGRIRPPQLHSCLYDGILGTHIIYDPTNANSENGVGTTPTSASQQIAKNEFLRDYLNRVVSPKKVCPYENDYLNDDYTNFSPIYNNWIVNYPVAVYTKNQLKNCYTYFTYANSIFEALTTYKHPLLFISFLDNAGIEVPIETLLADIVDTDLQNKRSYHYAYLVFRYAILHGYSLNVLERLWDFRSVVGSPPEFSYGKIKYKNAICEPFAGISLAKNLIVDLCLNYSTDEHANTFLDALKLRYFSHKLKFTGDALCVEFTYTN